MALPDELLDELLSAHLDGALSGDERARVEQMLRDDSDTRARFESLKAQSLATSLARYRVPALPDDFSDKVLESAIRQAGEEQLAAGHPLRIAADKTAAVGLAPQKQWSPRRVAAIIAGLAAAIMIASFALRDTPADPESDQPIALRNSIEDAIASVDVVDRVTDPDQTIPGPDVDSTPIIPSAENRERIASAPTTVTTPGDSLKPDYDQLAGGDPDKMGTPATSGTPSENLIPATSDMVSSRPIGSLQSMLVIEVRQTESGKRSDAMAEAMEWVGIESSEERKVDEPLVAAIAKEREEFVDEEPESDGGRVLLLEAPAKKLDRLVNRLVADRNGIASVGFSLVDSVPMLRSVETVLADPTEVRHQGRSFPIVGESDRTFERWSGQLGDRAFAPMAAQSSSQTLAMAGIKDDGPDQMANLLIIVR